MNRREQVRNVFHIGTETAAQGMRRESQKSSIYRKLLVAVGCHGAGDVVHNAAPSGRDIERACRRIGIRRNIPINEHHRSSGSSRSVPIVLPFDEAVAHSYNLVRLGFVCNTRLCRPICHPFRLPVVAKTITGAAREKKSRMISWRSMNIMLTPRKRARLPISRKYYG